MYRLYIYSNKEGVEIMKKWVALMHNEESIHFYTGIVVNWRNGAC